MASGTIPAPRSKTFEIIVGNTLTIRPTGNQTNFAFMLYCCGVRSGINSALYYVTGYSQNSSYHVINTLVAGNKVAVATASGDITVQNTHASDSITVVVDLVFINNGNLTFTVS